jgi:signal transduction histidine kinase
VQVSNGNLDVAVSFSRAQRRNRRPRTQLQSHDEAVAREPGGNRAPASHANVRAEHLATLGELATGLAHEIRNPLAGIAGVVEIVGRDLACDQPGARSLKMFVWKLRRSIAFDRPSGNGAAASAADSPEQSQHDRGTRRDAGPPAGALESQSRLNCKRRRIFLKSSTTVIRFTRYF